MSTYSEYYFSKENKLLKLLRIPPAFIKYYLCEELLATRVVEIVENVGVDFGKNLMDLAEMKIFGVFQYLSEVKVAVNEIFTIPAEPLQLYNEKLGKHVEIPVPSSHVGPKPISCRLFSASKCDGMVSLTCFLW